MRLRVHGRFFYMRDYVEEGECDILHLRTGRQLSDTHVQVVDGEHVWVKDYLWA